MDFLKEYYNFTVRVPVKLIKFCIDNNINSVDDIPNCKCGKKVSYNKAYPGLGFISFCGPICSRSNKTISKEASDKLYNYDWLYEQRIVLKKSKELIAEELHISTAPINKAIKLLNIPKVRYNESDYKVSLVLNNKDELENLYHNDNLNVRDIAKKLNTSASTVSIFLNKHGIKIKESNSYPRVYTKRSIPEKEIYDFLQPYFDDIVYSNKSILGSRELDIYIPSKKFAIEHNGLFAHCDLYKDKKYHVDKTNRCNEKNIQLFHIWGDDWQYKKDIVKSMLMSKLGLIKNKIYARNCEIVYVDSNETKMFLNENHIQGFAKSSINIGLKYKNELVALMTLGKSRYNKDIDWELIRFSSKLNITVVGGFSKILSHFRKLNSGSIVSYADISYSNGNVYLKNGFDLEKINDPVYYYLVDGDTKRASRRQFTKEKLKEFNQSMSEADITKILKIKKIWNCGTYRFILK